MRWGALMHLGFNMWDDRPASPRAMKEPFALQSDTLRFDRPVWDAVVDRMTQVGMNLVVIDVGEGMRYDSHPELAVNGSWAPADLHDEVRRLRGRGIEAIPKLNFSASHDGWLGDYQHMVSSPTYYRVCADVIGELLEVFDRPRLFHIGMDEETGQHQKNRSQAVIRQHELWYHDVRFFADEVVKHGSRPWMWADGVWWHREEFLANVSRDIVQSNWYYDSVFEFPEDEREWTGMMAPWTRVEAYEVLDRAGYDQIPCGSCRARVNTERTVSHCERVLAPDHFMGFITAPWRPTVDGYRAELLDAVEQVGVEIARRR